MELCDFAKTQICFEKRFIENIKLDKTSMTDIFTEGEKYEIDPHMITFTMKGKMYRGCILFDSMEDHIECDGVLHELNHDITHKNIEKANKEREKFCEDYEGDETYVGVMILPQFVSEEQYKELQIEYAKLKLRDENNFQDI